MTFPAVETDNTNEGARALIDQAIPHAYLQWKGTDVCMDFRCPCGGGGHFDGMFAYYVTCPDCKREYEMAWHVLARPVDAPSGRAVLLEGYDA